VQSYGVIADSCGDLQLKSFMKKSSSEVEFGKRTDVDKVVNVTRLLLSYYFSNKSWVAVKMSVLL